MTNDNQRHLKTIKEWLLFPDVEGEEDYLVKKILDSNVREQLKFKIKWEGYGPEHDSWEYALEVTQFNHWGCCCQLLSLQTQPFLFDWDIQGNQQLAQDKLLLNWQHISQQFWMWFKRATLYATSTSWERDCNGRDWVKLEPVLFTTRSSLFLPRQLSHWPWNDAKPTIQLLGCTILSNLCCWTQWFHYPMKIGLPHGKD